MTDEQISGTIYRISNKITGKCYIGQTKNLFSKRIKQHKYLASIGNNKSALHRAFRKYGVENFCFMPIHENITTMTELNSLEVFYIKLYDTFNSGYNLTTGGESFIRSEETKLKIGIAGKNRKVTEAVKNVLREKAIGRAHSAETKEKLSILMKGNKYSDPNVFIKYNSDKVDKTIYSFYHPDHGRVDTYPLDLAIKYELSNSACHALVRGTYNSTLGWTLYINRDTNNRRQTFKVINTDNNEIISGSCKELSHIIGVSIGTIHRLTSGKIKQTQHVWELHGENND